MLAARRALAGVTEPKLVVYRVAAGPVPDGHWYHDPRQGGRLLGEVCHFVDTAQALVGAPIEDVTGLPGAADRADSTATTPWCRCASRTGRWPHRLRQRGPGGRQGVDRGPRRLPPGGHRRLPVRPSRTARRVWKGRQDKGHHALATAFRQAVAGGPDMPTEAMLATMRATIQAAARGRCGHD